MTTLKTVSEQYNELPIEVRNITHRVLIQSQLRDLKIERDRAVRSHKRHLKEIDDHISNVERELLTTTLTDNN